MRYVFTRRPESTFDSLFGDLFTDWSSEGKAFPAIDLYETDNGYTLEAEVASYDKDKVKIHVEKHILTLSYDEKEKEKGNYLVHEIRKPNFIRRFSLPEGIDEEKITADFKDGLVVITLPKTKEEAPKRIDIKFN